jgi:four helix bundle protein
MQNYRNLEVWKRAIEFCIEQYKVLEKFPASEMYGLVSQMKRSVVSIPSNIAEGAGRNSIAAEFKRFLFISIGSAAELETQIIIANKLNFTDKSVFDALTEELIVMQKMLYSLVKKL